jgi:hypothetical protein
MACWNQNLDIQNNKMDVGAGLQLPASMNFAQRTTLESKLTHTRQQLSWVDGLF